MKTGVPCNEKRLFPVRIDSQGISREPYRVWVYSLAKKGHLDTCKYIIDNVEESIILQF